MFQIFVTLDKHQHLTSFVRQTTPVRLNIRPATLKIRLLVILKLLTISSNCMLRLSASQHSIVQLLI